MGRALGLILLVAGCSSGEPMATAPRVVDAAAPRAPDAYSQRSRSEKQRVERLFARAHQLDAVTGDPKRAEALYRKVVRAKIDARDVQALAHLRLAELCRLRKDRRCAMAELEWIISRAADHPRLARRAEIAMVRLLHPRAGKMSALTRGPPVGYTSLVQVPGEVTTRFHAAEQALLRYVGVRFTFRMHNVDAVRTLKRVRLNSALKAYEGLKSAGLPNVLAAALFRQGSLHQDYAEALGRIRIPEEFLPREAAKLRVKFHAESVTHFQQALGAYQKVRRVKDVAAERWRLAARKLEDQLGRLVRRRPPGGAKP